MSEVRAESPNLQDGENNTPVSNVIRPYFAMEKFL